MSGYGLAERDALADLLLEVGPDAPTLCEGWAARDLAAHVAIRERRPDAALGIVVGPLAAWTQRVQASTAETAWPQLVEQVRRPPGWSPMRVEALHEPLNLAEMAVHHEDVRRAQSGWEPRRLDPAEQQALWARLRRVARICYRRSPVGVTIQRPGGRPLAVNDAEPRVAVTGEPLELLLHAYGRGAHARVELTGPPDAVEALQSARLGL